ncbi:MAG: hypothetical protein JW864_08380 [Spirochaetes bacterium]|nr:hypothetical protein [Spirochaetota bacterium]
MFRNAVAAMLLCSVSVIFPPTLTAQSAPGENEGYNNSCHFVIPASGKK